MFGFLKSGEIRDLEDIRGFLMQWLKDFDILREKLSPALFRVTHFIIAENIELYSSIITLRKRGHFLSCLILGRSILENSVNLQYIYREDTERRAINYDIYALSQYVEKAHKLEEVTKEQQDLLQRMDEELKVYEPSGDKKNHWDGKNIWVIFSELNLQSFYTEVYKRLSGFTHPTFGRRDFTQNRPIIDFYRGLLTKEIFVIVLESIRVVSEKFDMEDAVAIIEDYPKGAVLAFSTNRKMTERKQTEKH